VFEKILIANRGEIACRIARTCRRLGIRSVAVFSDADANAPHVRAADEAVRLGPPPVVESYLRIDALIAALRQTGARAVHPGYGLLSESRQLAEAVAEAGAVFVGPPPAALEAFGDKIRAREVARSAGVEPPPGSFGPLDPADLAALETEAARIGFPVLVKAAGGGGGIGMQIVREPAGLERAAKTCSDRGRSAFADARIYLERYLEEPRHIEVQVLCDAHGASVALGERECSVQRRHQKILEESPSAAPFFAGESGERKRQSLFADALRVVERAGYVGAGTVEFVADRDGRLYFLEVNARLQVEHPVTELVTGLDLVELQLRIADGERLPEAARTASRRGHAIEARLYAEDPDKGFLPQPGRIAELVWPAEAPGLRIDAGVEAGSEVTPFYDPLLAKLVTWDSDRKGAIARLDQALADTRLELVGPKGPRATNRDFLRRVLADERFRCGQYDTSLAETLVQRR
jgi:acetyl-CoA carboxylase biotin carboxylase subunit/3-methylcrotonyl-CoA carboxylase alpha subunit